MNAKTLSEFVYYVGYDLISTTLNGVATIFDSYYISTYSHTGTACSW